MALAPEDVVLWYDIDEGSGTTLDNAEGTSGFDGTITGAAWGTGGPTNLPGTLDFTGNDTDKIDSNNSLTALLGDAGNDFTICMWVKVATPGGIGSGRAYFGDWGVPPNRSIYFRNVSGTNQFYISDNGTASELQLSASYSTTDTWALLVITRTGNFTEMFADTTSLDDNEGSFSLPASNRDLVFGNANDTTSHSIDGLIAQIIILNKVADAGEIAQIVNSGAGATYAQIFSGGSTSIKSISGVAQADIKSMEGVAIASIKSVAGVSNVS